MSRWSRSPIIGSGNVGRNTTIVRSNYLLPGNLPFYEHSMKLWEGLEQDLNYNAMVSQRGMLNVFHSDPQRDAYARRGNAMRLHGVDAELLDREQVRALLPFVDFDNARFPIRGGLCSARGGTVRHDAVAWGYARGADCAASTSSRIARSPASASKAAAFSGSRPRRALSAPRRWRWRCRQLVPGRRHGGPAAADRKPFLQAFVTEGLKPLIDGVMTFGAGHFYVSQSDKGGLVFGGDIDGYNSYAQRGNLPVIEDVCEGGMALMPVIGRVRFLRTWGGLMDMSMDGSPIIDKTPIEGLYFNGGWCYGGFKATPASGWCFAHLIAKDEPHPFAAAYRLDRFAAGRVIDEKGMGAQPNLH